MTFTIGRVSFECGPYSIRHDGDRLSFGVNIDGATTTDPDVAKVLRQQLLGLANNRDELVIPVTWDGDSDFDGFYRVVGVRVDPFDHYLDRGLMACGVDLERVGGGYADPVHEVYGVFAEAGTLTIGEVASADPFASDVDAAVYFPDSHTVISHDVDATGRTAEDGSSINAVAKVLDSDESWTVGVSSVVDPASFYDAGCTVEQYVAGSWWPLIGAQLPDGATVRVCNGLVRMLWSSADLVVESFDGVEWQSKEYTLSYDTGAGTVAAPVATRVLRNSVDVCVVRFVCTTTSVQSAFVDVAIRRGDPMITISVATVRSRTWKLTRTTTEAGAALQDEAPATYGIRASANDANGDRYVIVARDLATADTTNGGLTLAATPAPTDENGDPIVPGSDGFPVTSIGVFGVALEIGGSGATDPNDADAMGARFQIAGSLVRSVSS